MCAKGLSVLAVCVLLTNFGFAEPPQRMTVTVFVEQAEIRSGPSETAYATGNLRRGDMVEAYRQDARGWLAIRPPENSFSLVRQDQVRLTDDRTLGEVLSDNVPSWLGDAANDAESSVSHVQLKRGELVQILDLVEKSIGRDQPTESYYLIAPPAGEFRWIHADDVQSTNDVKTTARESVTGATTLQMAKDLRFADVPPLIKESVAEAPLAKAAKTESFWTRPGNSAPRRTQTPSNSRWAKRTDDLDAVLDEVNIQLSMVVAQDGTAAQLSQLREEVEVVVESGKTAVERGRARLLLDRIKQFEQLSRGVDVPIQQSAGTANEDTLIENKPNMETSNEAEEPSAKEPDPAEELAINADAKQNDSRYDGKGWLMPIHSLKRPAPPFALLDENGKVIKLVSPAPGLNLRRYVKKEVGIIGQRGFVPSLNLAHITAERVIDLDRHRR